MLHWFGLPTASFWPSFGKIVWDELVQYINMRVPETTRVVLIGSHHCDIITMILIPTVEDVGSKRSKKASDSCFVCKSVHK